MSAHIIWLEGTYTLIHIPLDLYGIFLQPILRVLIPQTSSLRLDLHPKLGGKLDGISSQHQHWFLNISVTELGCSVVCHTSWAKDVFEPVINSLPPEKASTVYSCPEPYMVLSVISTDLDAASRVLELSSPLAAAGVPIFFITAFCADFILAPFRERQLVMDALYERGFALSDSHSNFFSSRKNSATLYPQPPSASPSPEPTTPPPFSNEYLQSQTFDLLRTRGVAPYVVPDLELVSCSAREAVQFADTYTRLASNGRPICSVNRDNWIENVDPKFYAAVVSALLSQPRFLSVTVARDEEPSLLIDKRLLYMFTNSVVGDMDTMLVPIFLDLASLSSAVTGIVCVVSGRLVQELKMTASSELSYLSTARAGVVILPKQQAIRALAILEPLLEEPKE
ncbi:hypothetical protein E4U55_000652 [Claviceps digitariae]|nr:hypothetical protein E4U55_000652 [Claviceps digitariae]